MTPEAAYKTLRKNNNHKNLEYLEQDISTHSKYSYLYARNVCCRRGMVGRFVLGEAAISKNVGYSCCYARNVIHGRFELAEETICKYEYYSYWYGKYVIRRNWTEELAMKCPAWLYIYAKDVIKGRLPNVMHNKMIAFGIIDSSDKYVKKYLGSKKYCTLKRKDTKNESKLGI